MRWTRRRVETVTTRVIVVGWVVFYAVALATADQGRRDGRGALVCVRCGG